MEKNLKAYHIDAINLRWNGMRHYEIAKAINEKYGKNIQYQTIRWWFMQGGILYEKYQEVMESRLKQFVGDTEDDELP